jgi:hypothetical protein
VKAKVNRKLTSLVLTIFGLMLLIVSVYYKQIEQIISHL